nr:hypothetical protein CFP56_19376 [Quercus suber]
MAERTGRPDHKLAVVVLSSVPVVLVFSACSSRFSTCGRLVTHSSSLALSVTPASRPPGRRPGIAVSGCLTLSRLGSEYHARGSASYWSDIAVSDMCETGSGLFGCASLGDTSVTKRKYPALDS